ncbi:UDP-4-amino-4,6-dideoxy-N-acetyl-beta-L-altrosamine N-acetyltransferase [Psychrobacter celer]|uniref:UDP-4-amino-4, 6-dideoxy-N-acetyl-beta-L-altrosamine N-acetyltransferase n=1 Tax=Psychrobacter celer TaxID=306572 RepID=UPI003FD4FC9E
MDKSQLKLRLMQESDLELVLSWRNHIDVRRYMYTQHEISLTEHTNWFNKVSKDSNYNLLIFEVDNKPLGFVNIHQIAQGGIADWGFYTSPDAPKGTGYKLGEQALDYAFNTLQIHKLCGQALDFNEASRKFHKRLGFKKEGALEQHHFDGQKYYDVMCFGLLASEYHLITNNES